MGTRSILKNSKMRSCACARCACLLKHHPIPPITPLTVLCKPREHFPSPVLKPSAKALTGAQQFAYVLFFMKNAALSALDSTQGFEIGVGPSVVLVDQGVATSTTTITAQDDIYAFITDQKGAMAGIGIQGNKITKLAK